MSSCHSTRYNVSLFRLIFLNMVFKAMMCNRFCAILGSENLLHLAINFFCVMTKMT